MLRRIILGFFLALVILFAFFELRNLIFATSYDRAIAFGYFIALFYSIVFGFILRKILANYFSNLNKVKAFGALGLFGALIVETSIWSAQTVFQTTGAAISSNLFIDLIMTLPFYGALIFFFAGIATKNELSWKTVALLGGIYEIFADGIVGNLFKGNFLGILVSPLLLPAFVVVYAPIILIPYLIIFNSKLKSCKTKFEIKFLKPALAVLILPVSIAFGLILKRLFG